MIYSAAISLITIGIILRVIAMKTLRENFTEVIRTPTRVIRTGIYKYVKHPAYWGSMLILLGVSILSDTAAIMLLSFFFYRSRMVLEDEIINHVYPTAKN